MANVIFDLDGPLLDVKNRYYSVYKRFIIKNKGIPLDKESYWQLKRQKVPVSMILKKSDCLNLENEYCKYLTKNRELMKNLKLDTLQADVKKVLIKLKNNNDIYLITLRRNPQNLHKQLKQLGLTKHFNKILSKYVENQPKWLTKIDIIKKELPNLRTGFLIGDTETEIIVAKKLKLINITILNGIRTKKIIKKNKPNYMINTLIELNKIGGLK